MAVAAGVLSGTQRHTLDAVCDTFAPSLEGDGGEDPAVRELLARAASDLGVAGQVEGLMGQALTPEQLAGFTQLLDGLAEHEFASLPLEVRTQILHDTASSSPEAKLGIKTFRQLTFFFFYGLPDERGHNPNWEALGYPGPVSAPPSPEQAPKTIAVEHLAGEQATLTADVCVVGSGAGGGVVAARLAEAGRSVVVLELGEYANESDFDQLELPGMLRRYLGGGLLASEDGSIAILAGSTLGGGTVINYMNCLHTPEPIRREWAAAGLEGLDAPEYEQHMDAVLERLGVNVEATTQNRTHQRLIAGLDARGVDHGPIRRNADPACDDPHICGHCYTGCQRGCKRSTLRTFLQDASDAGARFVVGARAERVLAEDGHARGVEATVTNADGSTTRLTVEAPTVVVAGGSIESPALLLRSGIGGPAVGRHLRLHPAAIVEGVYEEPIEGWEGQIQSEVSHHYNGLEGDWGFLIEATYMAPALFCQAYPWRDGRQHKEELARSFCHTAPFITVQRDHGAGEVTLDDHGQALVRWSLVDEVDRRLFVRAQVELARLHHAAGAREIFTTHALPLRWREGEDFEAFAGEVEEEALYEANDVAIFSAHQMGSCRMGSDPRESVADGQGELHDVEGVWIGDASAFPSAPGVNPMISIMALARRTADAIVARAG